MDGPASELPLALGVMLVIAVPSIIMFCYILEEAPVKTRSGDTFEDIPFFCGLSANQCCDSPASASLLCFFIVVIGLLFFASASGLWFAVWGGLVARGGGFRLGDTVGTFSLLQGPHRPLMAFGHRGATGAAVGAWAAPGHRATTTIGRTAVALQAKPSLLKTRARMVRRKDPKLSEK
mmetsp:Transcript_38560/g.99648  ORF Transcript_38560/g.99648 Transcript_38560/m.99648 type:complete len:178 (-) Transcript_38560:117-650(-)